MPDRQRDRGWRILFAALALAIAFTLSCKRQPSGGEVWARVDGHPIYREQADSIYRQRIDMLPGENKPEQALSFKLNILNELIDNQILLDEAERMEITVSDQEMDARLGQLRSPDSGRNFSRELAKQGLTPRVFRQQVREDIEIQKLIQREIGARVSVSAQEIADYYAHNKANFTVPQTEYHLAQILVTPTPGDVHNLMNDDATNERQARRKIRALYAQLRAGEGFAKVAEEYSEDPRTAKG
ncbi:MAG: SurA N-terminal domain-containing protein, partial [Terriglobia bacterium]